MNTSKEIQKIAQALHLFHIKMDTIKYDSVNPFFNSKYASLTHILETIKMPLQESGLVLIQMPTEENGLTTMLVHAESGEFISSTYYMTADKNTPQAHGSVVSYQRRYCVQSILNLCFDVDDDANIATHGNITKEQFVQKQASAEKKKTTDEVEKQWLNENSDMFILAIEKLKAGTTTIEKIKKAFKLSKKIEEKLKEIQQSKTIIEGNQKQLSTK